MLDCLDCLVIGGGPAGLTAGIYLGRFLHSAVIVDGGWSRAEWITHSRNLSGCPEPINGHALLERMRGQVSSFGVLLKSAHIEALQRGNEGCPICDGYEGRGEAIAVLGDGEHAASEVLFMRTYTDRLSLLLTGPLEALSANTRGALDAAGIKVAHVGAGTVHIEATDVTSLCGADGVTHRFDALYTAFGTAPQSGLAVSLGARMDDNRRLAVNEHQETSVHGLFAAGDVVRGLNQISVAYGEAAIAATAVHNSLAKPPYPAQPRPGLHS